MYPQVQLRPFIPVIDGQPPVYPQFPVSHHMQRVVGYIGTEIIKALQNEASKNIVRATTYNYISDNNYNNGLFQELYKLTIEVLEYQSLAVRQDPAGLLNYIPAIVKAFIAYVWITFVNQPLDNELRHHTETSYNEYRQYVSLASQVSNRNYNQQYQVNQPIYNQPSQYYQNQNNFGMVQRNTPLGSGDRFTSYNANNTNNANRASITNNPVSTDNTFSRYGSNVPMASHSSEPRFTPIDNKSSFNESFNKQLALMDKGFEEASKDTVSYGEAKVNEVFKDSNTDNKMYLKYSIHPERPIDENTDLEALLNEYPIHWEPTKSQLVPRLYDPFRYKSVVVMNDKDHPVEKLIKIKLGENGMREEDHVMDIMNKINIHGPKPTQEEIDKLLKLESKLDILTEEKTSVKESTSLSNEEKNKVLSKRLDINHHVASVFDKYCSLDDYFAIGEKHIVEDGYQLYILNGGLTHDTVADSDLTDTIDYIANATSMDHVISKLMKLRKSEDNASIRLYHKLVSIYTDLANTIIKTVLHVDITFDDLVSDYPDLVNYLNYKVGEDIFTEIIDKHVKVLMKNKPISTEEATYTIDEKTYFRNEVVIPVTVAKINYTSHSLNLPKDKTYGTNSQEESLIEEIIETIYQNTDRLIIYLETIDNRRYMVIPSYFNSETYYLKPL